jgi:disulfide bond formation protein DsbB
MFRELEGLTVTMPAARFPSETSPAPSRVVESVPSGWIWAAWVVALLALAGSLFLSLGMDLKACPLCFYQRTFMMSVVGVLSMGLLTKRGLSGRLSLLVLPLAAAGLGVALFHVYLELTGKLECPQGLVGWGTAPKQSLASFAVLFALLVVDVLRGTEAGAASGLALVSAITLGGLLAVGSCTSNPPMPAPPREPYTKPVDICRPPYQPPEQSSRASLPWSNGNPVAVL